jgi:hypothetical protein
MSKSNFWQLVFNQSRVNGAEYFGDQLPNNSWDWPKDTFLQKRLNELKKRRPVNSSGNSESDHEPMASHNRKRRHTRHEKTGWLRAPESMSSAESH